MSEVPRSIFDAAHDVRWLGEEKKPRFDGILRSYGRQIREMAKDLGVLPTDFVAFIPDGKHLFLGTFLSGSYDGIYKKAGTCGFHILRESEAASFSAQLGKVQGPELWSFLESPEVEASGWASAVRFVGDRPVQHKRSPHGESPFCGAWVVTTNTKTNS